MLALKWNVLFLLLALLSLAACNAKSASSADPMVEQLKSGIENKDPSTYYVLAAKLFEHGDKDEAVFWFYLGQLRFRFELLANPSQDPSGGPALFGALSAEVGGPINEYAFGDIPKLAQTIDAVLQWDATHDNTYTPKQPHQAALTQVRQGLLELKQTTLARQDQIKIQRRADGLDASAPPSPYRPFSPFNLLKIEGGSDAAGTFFPDPKVAALARALEHDDWAAADKALRNGADVNAVGQDNMTLPMWSMYIIDKKAFEWLFTHGANPNLNLGPDRCIMYWVARAEETDWLRIMLAHKANPNLLYKNSIGVTETPLMATTLERRLANLKMLIAAGADVNYQEPKSDGGGTAAIAAADFGWFEGTYVLLEAGADFRPRTSGGADLAYLVAERNFSSDLKNPFREKVLQLLRARGADVDGAIKKVRDDEAQDRKDNPWRYHDAN